MAMLSGGGVLLRLYEVFEQCWLAFPRASCWWLRSVHRCVFGLCCLAGACNRPLLSVGLVGLPVAIVGPVASSSHRSTQYSNVRASRSRSGGGCDQWRSPTQLLGEFLTGCTVLCLSLCGTLCCTLLVCLHRSLSRVVDTQAGIVWDCRCSTSSVASPTAKATSASPRCLCSEGVELCSTFRELVERAGCVRVRRRVAVPPAGRRWPSFERAG